MSEFVIIYNEKETEGHILFFQYLERREHKRTRNGNKENKKGDK